MIEVEELTRYFGSTRALDDVTFGIEEREIVGFLGLNGAGKSTLLRILSGLLMPSSGRVRIDGIDAVEAPDSLRRRIGFLPENPPLYRNMQVGDFLAWVGRTKGAAGEDVSERLPEVAVTCGIEHKLDDVISTLSHGYRKRVGIAQAIIHDPELVILDEPISGLDPAQIVEMRDVLDELRRDRTVLVSSHILGEISETCERILVLHDGRLVADGTERELASRLGAKVRLEIEARGAPDDIEAVMSGHELVADWSVDRSREDIVDVQVRLVEDDREKLLADVVESGVGLREVVESGSELENAFLGVTEESEQSASQPEAAQ